MYAAYGDIMARQAILLAINIACLSVQFLGDNTTHNGFEACNSTQLRLVQLQASEPVTRGIITQTAHLAMLLIMLNT